MSNAASNPVNRGRKELNVGDIKIDQKNSIKGDKGMSEREPDVIIADQVTDQDYIAELAFNEEPVTIRLEPSAEKFAPKHFPVWVNGKGAEVMMNGRWMEMAYLPVGVPFTTKRKYVAVIVSAKRDSIQTQVHNRDSDNPENVIERFTSAATSFSVIEDKNPKGAAWLTELRRRMG